MKVGFIASPIVYNKERVYNCLDNCGFTITTLFPIGSHGRSIIDCRSWASDNGVSVNDLLEGEEISFNGARKINRAKKIVQNKDNLALVALWDGGSSEIKQLVELCQKYNIPRYVTNGRYIFGV